MKYELEFMQGLIMAAGAFITGASIIAGFLGRMETNNARVRRNNKIYGWLIIISIGFGAVTITLVLNWLNQPNALIKLYAIIFLLFQFLLMWLPASRLITESKK